MVRRGLVPRPDKRALASRLDIFYIYLLETQHQINFPAIFITHLTHCISHNNVVGYGSLLTYIMRKVGVDLTSYTSEPLTPAHILNPACLNGISLNIVDGVVSVGKPTTGDTTQQEDEGDEGIEEEEELSEEEGEVVFACEEKEGHSKGEPADLRPKEKYPPKATSNKCKVLTLPLPFSLSGVAVALPIPQRVFLQSTEWLIRIQKRKRKPNLLLLPKMVQSQC